MYVLVHNFLRKRCNGSRKWSWLIQWMNWDFRHLLVVFQCRILKYLMRGLLRHWIKSSRIPSSKGESVWRNKRPRKRTVSFEVDRLPTWSTINSGSLEPMILSKTTPTCSLGIRFEVGWNSIVHDENPTDETLEGLHKLRIRESEKLKTVLELYDLETDQKKLGPDYHRLKTMVKRSIEQEIRNKNFGSRIGNFEKNAVVKNQGTKQRGQRILGDCWQDAEISTQWTIPRYQSTSVFPTSSRSWRDAKPSSGSDCWTAMISRQVFGTPMVCRETVCPSNGVFFIVLSARVQSVDFQRVGTHHRM